LFGEIIMARQMDGDVGGLQGELEREVMASAQSAALQIVGTYLHIASKGLMTYCEFFVLVLVTSSDQDVLQMVFTSSISSLKLVVP
jgi:hypothetical protein